MDQDEEEEEREILDVLLEDEDQLDSLLYNMAGLDIFQPGCVAQKGIFLRTVSAAARRVIDTLGPFSFPLRKGTSLFYTELCLVGRNVLHRIIIGHPLTMNDVLTIATTCVGELATSYVPPAPTVMVLYSVAEGPASAQHAGPSGGAQTLTAQTGQSSGQLNHPHSTTIKQEHEEAYSQASSGEEYPSPRPTACNYTTLRKEDPHRLGVVGMAILLVSATRGCKYDSLEELLSVYPEFSSSGADLERAQLLENANMMASALSFVTPTQNKGVLLSIVPRLTEGPHVKYVTGGGSSRATLDRVMIFEREGNCTVRRRSMGNTVRNKRKAGQYLAQRRQLVRLRLALRGQTVSNAELMRRARDSLEKEGEEAFADLFENGLAATEGIYPSMPTVRCKDKESKKGLGISHDHSMDTGGTRAATSPSLDRTDDSHAGSSSTTSSPRSITLNARIHASTATQWSETDGQESLASATDDQVSNCAIEHGTDYDGLDAAAMEYEEGSDQETSASHDDDLSCSDPRGRNGGAAKRVKLSNGDEGGANELKISTTVPPSRQRHAPAFFAIEGSDGYPVCPTGALAALHLRLACTVDTSNRPITTPTDQSSCSLRHGIELQHSWSDTGSLWPLACTTLPACPLAKHPSLVVDTITPEPAPQVKPPAVRRDDAYSSPYVYSSVVGHGSRGGSTTRPRIGTWRNEDAVPRSVQRAVPRSNEPVHTRNPKYKGPSAPLRKTGSSPSLPRPVMLTGNGFSYNTSSSTGGLASLDRSRNYDPDTHAAATESVTASLAGSNPWDILVSIASAHAESTI